MAASARRTASEMGLGTMGEFYVPWGQGGRRWNLRLAPYGWISAVKELDEPVVVGLTDVLFWPTIEI